MESFQVRGRDQPAVPQSDCYNVCMKVPPVGPVSCLETHATLLLQAKRLRKGLPFACDHRASGQQSQLRTWVHGSEAVLKAWHRAVVPSQGCAVGGRGGEGDSGWVRSLRQEEGPKTIGLALLGSVDHHNPELQFSVFPRALNSQRQEQRQEHPVRCSSLC